MDPIKTQIKVTKYLDSLAGKTITKQELLEKISETNQPQSRKQDPKKNKFFKKRSSVSEIQFVVNNLLIALENEKLVTLEGKKIQIKKPFRLYGRISISRKGDGFVSLPAKSEIFIPFHHVQTAISGDRVEVKPICMGRKDRLEGEVTQIIKRGRELYRMRITEDTGKLFVGTLLDMLGDSKEGYVLKNNILTEIKQRIKPGDIAIVRIKDGSVSENHLYEMSFVGLESDQEGDPDLNRILMKYGFQIQHPEEVLETYNESVSESTVTDWDQRVDLRDLYSVTIDGETAKDFDDAISFQEENGKIRFWVHIADVSYYVKKDSPLDQEAFERATSVYLSNRVVPMLPPILSENLCSLISGVNRLAFTVEMEASPLGEIYSAKFYKSIIFVNKRYTYEMAEQEILEKNPNNWMFQLSQFTSALRKARMKKGRVDLNLKEISITIDSNNKATEIMTKTRLESHMLIEELMLSANQKVDEFLRKRKIPNLHRVHESMDEEKLEMLNQFLQLNGVKAWIEDTSYEQLKKALDSISDPKLERLFNYLLLRSFMQAYYGAEAKGHWGLGFTDYCHFTSPIRRYPDLIVHRVLHHYLLTNKPLYEEGQLGNFGRHCSDEERRAADAERDISKLRSMRFLESSGRDKFYGSILGIRPNQIYLELEDTNVEGILDKSEFTDEFEILIRNDFTFYSKKFTKDFYIGDRLQVALDRFDYEDIKLYLKLVSVGSKKT